MTDHPLPLPIRTSKITTYQIPGKPLRQMIGKTGANKVPGYRTIKRTKTRINVNDPQRFQQYMLFQSGSVRLRLAMQRITMSYPFLRTSINATKNFDSYTRVQNQLQNYFEYLQDSSTFQIYLLDRLKTSTLSLTSSQGDLILIPFFDLYNTTPLRLFQVNVQRVGGLLKDFDDGILHKDFSGRLSGGVHRVYNNRQTFTFIQRDRDWVNQVPRQYSQSVNRRGQIFNLVPSIYYRGDSQFEALLNIWRQNYDKAWLKIKAIKNIQKISYDKGKKQFLGDFIKQALRNKGIDYYDINPRSITNMVLYNFIPKNINSSNSRYIPVDFSYRYLSDQFAWRLWTQKSHMIRSKGSRQTLQRITNMYGLRNRPTGDFSRLANWVNIVDFQRFHSTDSLINRVMTGGTSYFTDLQSTIDDQVWDRLANSLSSSDQNTFQDFGLAFGFGLVIDLVQNANKSLRQTSLIDHGLTNINFSDSMSSYVLGTQALTGNRIDMWSLYGPTGNDMTFSFSRRFEQIRQIDYILNPFFNVRQQFYSSRQNHIDGVFIRPSIYDMDTISDKRLSPGASGQKSNDHLQSVTSSLTGGQLITQMAFNNDLKFFEQRISSQINVIPKRQTQIEISNITQLQDRFNTRTINTKSFIMQLYGFDVGTSTFRFKRRTDDTIGNDQTDKILNMLIKLKQRSSGKIVQSTNSIVKITFNAVQDLYSNSPSQDNLDQYNNIKKQFNFVDFYIYPQRLNNRSFIFKQDLLQKQYILPVTDEGILLSIFGWSGFDVQTQKLFEWTLNIQDLSSGDITKFQFKFRNQQE